ncbi:glycoside hydrolase family 43 protein [Bacillus sinesaloumensis]|uniref:glycoside hydrolase family 43 protein n=1 Tax=Litchfieldia sinesaloumensis TaxID=1926280 RepID=UPI0009886A63|nr:glycoside hydrolase family 43 protein [Bacillus sinesaloumensis]
MTTNKRYRNPVISGFYPDPSVIRVGDDDFYLVTSSFEYFPAVPIFHSKDLINWEQIGSVLTREDQVNLSKSKSSQGIYAPTLRYNDGTFYMIVTDVMGHGNFYVSAKEPRGPWSAPIKIPYGNIDPSLMFDEDGKVYVSVQNGEGLGSHIIQYEIDIETGEALTEPVVVFHGDGGVWTEAPHLYKINGMYYMLTACGGTAEDHRAIIGRSANPYGPFERLEHPILTHNRLKDHILQNLGHADLVDDKHGNWWAVFLGIRSINQEYGHLGRETFLAPVTWTEDGWPMIDNNEGTVDVIMETDALLGESILLESVTTRDEFDDSRLAPTWFFLRTNPVDTYSLTERSSWLQMIGNAYNLNDIATPAFICRPQQHHNMEFNTLLDFNPVVDGEEAGIAVRLNEYAHYEIGLKCIDGKRFVVATQTINGKTTETARVETGMGPLHLSIKANEETYLFRFASIEHEWIEIAKASAAFLAPEKNGGYATTFTGVCLGMYATGNGEESTTPAYFDWVSYTGSF